MPRIKQKNKSEKLATFASIGIGTKSQPTGSSPFGRSTPLQNPNIPVGLADNSSVANDYKALQSDPGLFYTSGYLLVATRFACNCGNNWTTSEFFEERTPIEKGKSYAIHLRALLAHARTSGAPVILDPGLPCASKIKEGTISLPYCVDCLSERPTVAPPPPPKPFVARPAGFGITAEQARLVAAEKARKLQMKRDLANERSLRPGKTKVPVTLDDL